MERASELGPHLGPILLQLPPDMTADLDRLATTLDVFPRGVRVAVEPRHASWFTEDLRRAADLARRRACVSPTGAVRSRRSGERPTGRISASTLAAPRRHPAMANVPSRHGRRGSPTDGDKAPTATSTSTTITVAARCAMRRCSRGCSRSTTSTTGGRPDPGDPVLAAAADANPRTGVMLAVITRPSLSYGREAGVPTVCERRRRSGERRPSLDPVPVVPSPGVRVPSCLVGPFPTRVRPARTQRCRPVGAGIPD